SVPVGGDRPVLGGEGASPEAAEDEAPGDRLADDERGEVGRSGEAGLGFDAEAAAAFKGPLGRAEQSPAAVAGDSPGGEGDGGGGRRAGPGGAGGGGHRPAATSTAAVLACDTPRAWRTSARGSSGRSGWPRRCRGGCGPGPGTTRCSRVRRRERRRRAGTLR